MSEAGNTGLLFLGVWYVGMLISALSVLSVIVSSLAFERRDKFLMRQTFEPGFLGRGLFTGFYNVIRALVGVFGGFALSQVAIAIFTPRAWWGVLLCVSGMLVCWLAWRWLKPRRMAMLRRGG